MKRLIISSIFTVCILNASSFQDTATLLSVNGASSNGVYTSPYEMLLGTSQIEVWCVDPRINSQLDNAYLATVWSGDSTPIFGWSTQVRDAVFALISLAEQSLDKNNPLWQQAIWNEVDPADYQAGTDVSALEVLASGVHVDLSSFILITGPNEQSFVSQVVAAPNVPEPSTWVMGLIGYVLFVIGFVRVWGKVVYKEE